MNSVLDAALVGVVLAVSMAYAVYSLGPRAWRPRLLGTAAALLVRFPQFLGLRSVVRRLQAASVSKSTSACGGCDNCGTEPVPPGQTEINVPLSTIGKRNSG